MNKNTLFLTAIAVIGMGTFTLTNLRAQSGTAPTAPTAVPQARPPGFAGRPGGMPPGFRNRSFMLYHSASGSLTRAKMELERSKEDYDGHRQSAIDACDKAIHELESIQESIRTAEAAKAAAAKAAAAAAQQNAAPAAAPATTPAAPAQ